ncbi:MAG: 30S ribosomal protein S2 [Proteobacteria bacterium]|nr:30S ribosomal protein S2 [Pseudomonadota bacterium]
MSVKVPTIKELFSAGVHYGHQSNKWNPKMQKYIHTQNLGIHIIDLTKTEEALKKACEYLYEEASNGSQIIFVGTKKQASEIIKIEAKKAESNFVSDRWIGGMLTNVSTIRSNIKKLNNLRSKMNSGEFESFTKKEKSLISKEILKLETYYSGIETLTNPKVMVVVDPKKETTAMKEANNLGLKIVALADTNSNPEGIDYLIPGNDDAIRSIDIVISTLANAVISGRTAFNEKPKRIRTTEEMIEAEKKDKKEEKKSENSSDTKSKSSKK